MSNIYAKKGEIVTCTNGHPVAMFTKTVYVGDIMNLDEEISFFSNQKKPNTGDLIEDCICFCGGRYIGGISEECEIPLTHAGYPDIFHFKEGWRCECVIGKKIDIHSLQDIVRGKFIKGERR